jgi:predicted RNase H-like nuclease (RuvC/YqgF family)
MVVCMRIFGIDPGVTTGLAVVEDGVFVEGRESMTYDGVIDWLTKLQPDTVAIEDFQIRPGKPCLYHPSIRMIGVVEYACQRMELNFRIQSPSILKIMLANTKGISKSPHIRSAAAHALYCWRKNGTK